MPGLQRPATAWLVLAVASAVAAACGSSTATGQPSGASGTAASPSSSQRLSPSAVAATPSPSRATSSAEPGTPSIRLDVVVDGLSSPVDVAAPDDGSGRLFVVEQAGRIRLVEDGGLATRPFLDIVERVTSGGERGLLGLAFHPEFPADPRLFVDYTDLNGDTVVSEFRLAAGQGDLADPSSERTLLHIDQPYENHNGGALAFGPDGMLYVSTGDGGSGGDPQGNGQRLDTLLGKVLRIDVDGEPDGALPYRVPDDNPFVAQDEAEPEIWLTGLRNPWRLRFDFSTGNLWIGDVGQGAWEEIDVAPEGTGGLNFGWNVMEGFHCFEPREGCDERGLTLPVAEYGHDLGCAVIGGVVVRESNQALLDGRYVFSDSCSGNVWLLDATSASERQEPVLIARTGRSISSMALAPDGTLLATDLAAGALVSIAAVAP